MTIKGMYYHETEISAGVECDGRWPGTATDAAVAVDKAIDGAINQLTAKHGLVRPIAISCSPVKYGSLTFMFVTVIAEPFKPK